MNGLEGATVATRDTLRRHMAAKVAELRRRYHLDAVALPDVALIELEDRPRLEAQEWPGILIVGLGFGRGVTVDNIGGRAVWHRPYQVEARIWARVERAGFEAAGLQRFRYMLAVTEILLGATIADDEDQVACYVDPATVAGQANRAPIADSAGRAVSNGTIAASVIIEEHDPPSIIGTAATLEVEAHPIDEEA